ncbi:MAG: hypothetical protein Udaeo2_20780 [Candidatus Udaeobacter sp.]|nr:MAG: hypothetical protein Udaeo2_20780 [Candidatus Udaeobacter sp.]
MAGPSIIRWKVYVDEQLPFSIDFENVQTGVWEFNVDHQSFLASYSICGMDWRRWWDRMIYAQSLSCYWKWRQKGANSRLSAGQHCTTTR